jgi:hypothetical protein
MMSYAETGIVIPLKGVSWDLRISLAIRRTWNLTMAIHSPHCKNIFCFNEIFMFSSRDRVDVASLCKKGIRCEGFTCSQMDQRTICLYLNKKGLSAQTIHDELVQIPGFDAVTYSTMISYLDTSRWSPQNEEQHLGPPSDFINNVILPVLNQTQLSSVRELAKSMYISREIVWRRPTQSLGFVVKHLHWPRYPPDRCTMIKCNRSVKRLAQTLRVGTG